MSSLLVGPAGLLAGGASTETVGPAPLVGRVAREIVLTERQRPGEPLRAAFRRLATALVAGDAVLSWAEAAPLTDLSLDAFAPPVAATAAAPVAPAEAPPLPPSLFADPQPPPARTPLAVRRTADRPRSRATPHVVRRPRPALLESPVVVAADADVPVVDVALLAGIDAAVVYLTAQIASVPMSQVMTLPLVPLAAFIVGLNVAYLAVFTANGGQTLGKMATGLRVEATDGALTFGGAIVRVAAALAGGLVVGAGFVPALFRADRRAVHDQIAHTRVVKVGA